MSFLNIIFDRGGEFWKLLEMPCLSQLLLNLSKDSGVKPFVPQFQMSHSSLNRKGRGACTFWQGGQSTIAIALLP